MMERNNAPTFLAEPPRYLRSPRWVADNRALTLVIVAVIGLTVVPETIHHLIVEHVPNQGQLQAIESRTPLASLASWAGSAFLLGLCSVAFLIRGHPNRDITRLLILLLAFNLPYVVGPSTPGPADVIKIILANAVFLAIWNTGAAISELKWIPIIVSGVGVYSIIGGLVIPEHMMYNKVSQKALVAGWELAGPFGHPVTLGVYCGIAFALVPLVPGFRWQLLCGSILFSTIVASATRTALIASAAVIMWWLFCWLRSATSVRRVGTILVTICASGMFIVPVLGWDPDAFTGRALVWVESLRAWRESPVVGLGFDWFRTDALTSAEVASWAHAATGHNVVVDTLVKSGLVGLAALIPLWVVAILVARSLRITSQQIACFGYLIAIFVIATTEAAWDLWPSAQQFVESGLVFAVLVLTRDYGEAANEPG